MTIAVTCGDCVDVLGQRIGPLFDACVTDPPYHLTSIVKRFGAGNSAPAKVGATGAYARASRGFMGQQWDGGDVAFRVETWRAIYDQMKHGAHLIAFSGTRTYHRMVCAIEDAGFEIRDQLAWIYGSGFPKSHNIGDGWGTALKPAWEPIALARKPLVGTVAGNVLAHGTGALNIDGCRIGETGARNNGRAVDSDIYGKLGTFKAVDYGKGRFPANILHDGSDEVAAGFPTSDGTPGVRTTGGIGYGSTANDPRGAIGHADSGSASRFFYSAKAGPLDRLGSEHPTVKPVDLMRWLVRLVTPTGGLILDPFAGSGTTGIAAMSEGFSAELIDLEPKHVADIERKLASLRGEGARVMEQHVKRKAERTQREPSPLFGDAA